MIATLKSIHRHPIKSIGVETLASASLAQGRAMPLDRMWAVLHSVSKISPENGVAPWAKKPNFFIGRSHPELMCVTAETDGDTITLHHPRAASITFAPDTQGADLIDWLNALVPDAGHGPTEIVRAADAQFTDQADQYVSVLNTASLADLSAKTGRDLSPARFRGNLWVDGWAPFAETDIIGKDIKIGDVTLTTVTPIERCRATDTNTVTGERDIDILRALGEHYNTRDLGIFCKVTHSGTVAVGDKVEVL
ncbi:hypothetical protein BVC71_05865 [Marivivens niveibacter]|uniref:MOSC domain-containing protein n=1 Tax=Marivivens niveibacter TaxID=1930667 RepID=A0A251WY23_9RHOB|nr:MOSC domain-containing protein [Marivivens niveibacter]OUD09380.1 hypothetical protein BVC71_05865 [Marivivens niveibacter]